mmetsp:Transcript_23450/g.65682  ORF Transcript_23450/g.65682 Transcript_23450/m.65682 type:complete len:151 (-) Transcript_23450:201-653(-)
MGNKSSCCGSTVDETGKTKSAEVVPASPGPASPEPATTGQDGLPGIDEETPAPDHPAKGGGGELVFLFSRPDGSEREVKFTQRPLGMTFYMLKPLKVKSVTPESAAASQGVEEGWQLREVNGEDMVTGKAIEDIKQVISSLSSKLPMSNA